MRTVLLNSIKLSLLPLFISTVFFPAISKAFENSNIFKRLDHAKTAAVIEYTCDNETVKDFPFAEICQMRDGGIVTFSPHEICGGYPNRPDCTFGNIQVFNRSSAVYVKYNNIDYTFTSTHLLFHGGTVFTELKNRDIACYPIRSRHYPHTDVTHAVFAEANMNIPSRNLDGKEVTICGIIENIPVKIRGTALYAEEGLTKTKGEIHVTGITDTAEYLKRRFVMKVPPGDWRGLSGAPVYYHNKLTGIVSSGADTFITFNPPEDILLLLKRNK